MTTGPEWGLSFSYDGFGNRLNQTVTKGSAPTQTITVNPATNRADTLLTYDANGNVTSGLLIQGTYATLSYDYENRLASVDTIPAEQYAYSPDNKRIWMKKPDGTEEIHFYGVSGQKLGQYRIVVDNYYWTMSFTTVETNQYFGGRYIVRMDQYGNRIPQYEDRLGSVVQHFPYGEEKPSPTASDKVKFATYYRDATTNLDYADQRYYMSQYGRFLTPDPYQGSGGPANPGSWNRYAYVEGDPVNAVDPSGLVTYDLDDWGLPIFGFAPRGSSSDWDRICGNRGQHFFDGTVRPTPIICYLGLAALAVPPRDCTLVETRLPSSGLGYYTHGVAAHRYGHWQVIADLLRIAAAWAAKHPDIRIGIGDIAKFDGGDIGSVSHLTGLDVDIRPLRLDGKEEWTTIYEDSYSSGLTNELIQFFRSGAGGPL